MTEIPLETLLEATLFSAGRSLDITEMSETLGYDEEEIIESLGNLQSTIKRRKQEAYALPQPRDSRNWEKVGYGS